jgi:NAD(P)-dependent dehydrogenase (short-subunit alcohol dehydrogenase family)
MSGHVLAGAIALITGAAGGMGAAHARHLAAAGARVAVNDREASVELSALADELGGIAVPGDVSDRVTVDDIVDRVRHWSAAPDILVANHAYMSMGPLLEADLDDWWRIVDTNLGGTFSLIQSVLPGMRKHGRGRIVVVSSEWGITGWPEATAYCASKAGLISLVKTLGRELAPEGIIVNALAPGVTNTPQLGVDAQAAGIDVATMIEKYARHIPLGRIGEIDEIAKAVVFLSDFRQGSMVGQVLQVNGGSTRTRA